MDRKKLDEFVEGIEREAYRQGYRDALAQARSALTELATEAFPEPQQQTLFPSVASTPIERPAAFDGRGKGTPNEPRKGSDQRKVLDAIRTMPGTRGVDIANLLSPDVQERTVRTALHRLKRSELIRKEGDVWYPVERPKEKEDQPLQG